MKGKPVIESYSVLKYNVIHVLINKPAGTVTLICSKWQDPNVWKSAILVCSRAMLKFFKLVPTRYEFHLGCHTSPQVARRTLV